MPDLGAAAACGAAYVDSRGNHGSTCRTGPLEGPNYGGLFRSTSPPTGSPINDLRFTIDFRYDHCPSTYYLSGGMCHMDSACH